MELKDVMMSGEKIGEEWIVETTCPHCKKTDKFKRKSDWRYHTTQTFCEDCRTSFDCSYESD